MMARDVLLEILLPPVSILALLLLAVLLGRRARLGRIVLLTAVGLFFLASLPAVGGLLTRPLAGAMPALEALGDAKDLAAIVVPTAGVYRDATGRWWPTEASVLRATAGLLLRDRLALPLILVGGNPNPDEPSEARVLAEALELGEGTALSPEIRLETGARDSAESAAAVVALLGDGARRVLLVTSPTHVARMSAVLRHNGLSVITVPATAAPALLRLGDWLPQARGLGRTRAALYEYLGILWYLVSGRIALEDLTP